MKRQILLLAGILFLLSGCLKDLDWDWDWDQPITWSVSGKVTSYTTQKPIDMVSIEVWGPGEYVDDPPRKIAGRYTNSAGAFDLEFSKNWLGTYFLVVKVPDKYEAGGYVNGIYDARLDDRAGTIESDNMNFKIELVPK